MSNQPQIASELVIARSSRLQAMREASSKQQLTSKNSSDAPPPAAPADAELALARQLLDQRLQEILATLPAGKQLRLFKIRFGYEPEQIKQLSFKQAFKVLQISHQMPTNSQRIAELNYNGQPAR